MVRRIPLPLRLWTNHSGIAAAKQSSPLAVVGTLDRGGDAASVCVANEGLRESLLAPQRPNQVVRSLSEDGAPARGLGRLFT